jgi:hypothetical protein
MRFHASRKVLSSRIFNDVKKIYLVLLSRTERQVFKRRLLAVISSGLNVARGVRRPPKSLAQPDASLYRIG